jgi:hypothetical protein
VLIMEASGPVCNGEGEKKCRQSTPFPEANREGRGIIAGREMLHPP